MNVVAPTVRLACQIQSADVVAAQGHVRELKILWDIPLPLGIVSPTKDLVGGSQATGHIVSCRDLEPAGLIAYTRIAQFRTVFGILRLGRVREAIAVSAGDAIGILAVDSRVSIIVFFIEALLGHKPLKHHRSTRGEPKSHAPTDYRIKKCLHPPSVAQKVVTNKVAWPYWA
jgi:hypothetical protein